MVQVDYVNVGKDVYLIEVPESLKGFVPGNYELQSTKKVIRMFFPSCI
jgi:DNA mismatch repair protein MSH6